MAFVVRRMLQSGIRKLKWRGGIKKIIKDRLRSALTLSAMAMSPELRRFETGKQKGNKIIIPGGSAVLRAQKCLERFLAISSTCRGFKSRLLKTYEVINHMSGRLRNRNKLLGGKALMI